VLEDIRHAPVAQVAQNQDRRVSFKAATPSDSYYSPENEDILVFTHQKPTQYSDLKPYVIGVVTGETGTKDGKCTTVELPPGWHRYLVEGIVFACLVTTLGELEMCGCR
jgi:hypothetical protein